MDNETVVTTETTEAVNQQPTPVAAPVAPVKVDNRAPFDRQQFEGFLGHYPEAEQVVLERLGLVGAPGRLQRLEVEAARGRAVTRHGLTAEEAEGLPGHDADSIDAAAAYAAKIKAQYATAAKPDTAAPGQPPAAPRKPVEQPDPPKPASKTLSVEDAMAAIRNG